MQADNEARRTEAPQIAIAQRGIGMIGKVSLNRRFDAASVLLRDDQSWFVWIDVDDENREPELVDVGASNCVVGGTLGEPEWWTFGTVSRDASADHIAHYNDPLPSD